jgi:hypothetical protein
VVAIFNNRKLSLRQHDRVLGTLDNVAVFAFRNPSVVNPLFKRAIGEPTGAIPMVGYGAGAFISYLIERESLR